MQLTQKYVPKSSKDIIGQDENITTICKNLRMNSMDRKTRRF